MSGVTLVPSKSGLLTYFRFGEVQCASCGLSPTLGHVRREKINNGRIASTKNSDSRFHREIQVESEAAPKKQHLQNKS